MNKIYQLCVDQDWMVEYPDEGAILEFLGKDYDKNKRRTTCIFELVGHPVEKPKVEFVKIPCMGAG